MTVNNYMTSIIKILFFLIYKLIKPRTIPEMYTLKSLGPILYQTLFLFLNNGNADYVYGYCNICVVFLGFFWPIKLYFKIIMIHMCTKCVYKTSITSKSSVIFPPLIEFSPDVEV